MTNRYGRGKISGLKLNRAALLAGIGILLLIGIYVGYQTRRVAKGTIPSPTPSGQGAGIEENRGLETPTASPKPGNGTPGATPTTVQTSGSLITPVGQILNKTNISLSAAESDLQHNAAMVSTIIKATPGSSNIISASKDGASVTVAGPVTANGDGQSGEIAWNAKTAGLTAGTWSLTIVSRSGSATSSSSAEQLVVSP